jgi:general secretion pathway protein E
MKLIGEILRETCGLSEEALAEAIEIQEQKGGWIGEILVRQNAVSELDVLKALSTQFDLPFLADLPTEDLNTDFAGKVPIQFLKKYKMVPMVTSNETYVAVNDPFEFQPLDDLRLSLEWDGVNVVLAPYSAILSAINLAYDMSQDSAEQVIQNMHEDDSDQILSEIEATGDLLDETSEAPIIKLVNLMLSQAVKARASDIHVEPYQEKLKIRYRVDGILYDKLSPPKRIQSTLVSRIKVMAKLNIAEKRLPQDGRIEIRIADKNVDIRVIDCAT